jgi:phosphohistidine phosphatase
MLLYLLRHAEAEVLAKSDAARQLTPKGEQQAVRVGKFCAKHGIEPAVILSSPVVRARQTADRVHQSLRGAELLEAPWAACGMDAFRAMEELAAYRQFPAVMLVGHLPDLGFLAAVLLGMENVQNLRVRKALLAAIDTASGLKIGSGTLQFFLPVRLM